jgi:hypothetical protein
VYDLQSPDECSKALQQAKWIEEALVSDLPHGLAETRVVKYVTEAQADMRAL